MGKLYMVAVDMDQSTLRFARLEQSIAGYKQINYWERPFVNEAKDSISFDGWTVRGLRWDNDERSSYTSVEVTYTGGKVPLHKHITAMGHYGTLYLREKPKGPSAQYIENDPSAAAWLEFGVNEIRFISPKRSYPTYFTNPHGVECGQEWVHASCQVLDQHGDPLPDVQFVAKTTDALAYCGDVSIPDEAGWAVVDAESGIHEGLTCHYAVLFTKERRWDILSSSLRAYLKDNPILQSRFSLNEAIEDLARESYPA